MAEIAFPVVLRDEDWDAELSGWRCPALRIPGAVFAELCVDGKAASSDDYEADEPSRMVKWTGDDRPAQAMGTIRLGRRLSTPVTTALITAATSLVVAFTSAFGAYVAKEPPAGEILPVELKRELGCSADATGTACARAVRDRQKGASERLGTCREALYECSQVR